MSCSAASVVSTQSRNVSAIGLPALSVTASVSTCEPTWRTSSKLRPGSVSDAAVRRRVLAIGIQAAFDRAGAFRDRRRQRAAHDAAPVAIDDGLVGGVDGGDRVLAIHDRRERALEHDVLDAGRMLPADRMRRVDRDVDVQPVMAQQHVRQRVAGAPKPGELRGVGESRACGRRASGKRARRRVTSSAGDVGPLARRRAARPDRGIRWPSRSRARRERGCSRGLSRRRCPRG